MSLLSGLNFNKIFSGNAGGGELAIVEQILSPVIGNTLQALLTGQNAGDAFFGALGAVAQSAGSGIFAQAVNAVASENSGTVKNTKESRTENIEEKDNNKVYEDAKKDAKNTVKTIFEAQGWDIKSGIFKDAVAEYEQIIDDAEQKGTDITTDAFKSYVKLTIENYSRRVEFAHQELDWGLGLNNNAYEVVGLTQEDMKNNNAKAVKEAYENFANGEIAFYDTDNDNYISLEEYQAMAGATTDEDKALVAANFDIIDHDNDGSIDASESAAYNWAMSKILDKEGQVGTSIDITQDEAKAVADAMMMEALVRKSENFTKPENLTEEELTWLEANAQDTEKAALYNRFKGLLKTGNDAF